MAVVAAAGGCGKGGEAPAGPAARRILVVGYSVPGEAVEKEIAPAFARRWAEAHGGETIEFEFSWGASGAQTRAVLAGLEADVVYLAEPTDADRLAEAGLLAPEWNEGGRGIVSTSLVVLRTAPGNPKGIDDWDDVLRPGVKALTPNPRTSGLGKWNLLSLYGSVVRGGGGPVEAEAALRAFHRNVVTFAESARASTQDFERGAGDVGPTYENEVILLRNLGKEVAWVVPPRTVLIENPAAVVVPNARRHGVEEVAAAFVEFLRGPEAQRALAGYGFRPVGSDRPAGVFTVDEIGGWPALSRDLFGDTGLWARVVASEGAGR